ncbi:MAG: hypothetical protein ACJ79R_01950 [Anaeromyxobacteraceae bacterium]
MPNPNDPHDAHDPQQDIRPATDDETPAAPRSGATDEEANPMPVVPFGEDPGTLGVDDPTIE